MPMNAQFFSFAKRKNSLSRPSGGISIPVVLKGESSIINPVIEVSEIVYQYNYVYISQFSRWYYIDDIIWNPGVWILKLSVDVLATWSSYIRSTSAQVLFSSSSYNLNLIDQRIPATGEYTRNTTQITMQGVLANQQSFADGTFCLTAIDNTGLWATGATTTYFMTYQQMQDFAKDLLDSSFFQQVKQFFDNPMDAIIECYYIPVDVSKYQNLTVDRAIVVGDYSFPTAKGKSAQATNLANKFYHTTIDIPWVYDDFRRTSAYTAIEMFFPFCGSAPISPESCYNAEQLLIDYGVDITTGAVQAIVYLKDTPLQEFTGNCRVNLPLGQSQSRVDSILGTAGGAITAATGVVTGNVALGASGVLSAIGSAISPSEQKTMGGFSGSILGAVLGNDLLRWQQIRISVTSHVTNSSPASIRDIIGNVNGDVISLSELTGYVQTSGFSVSCPATETEIAMVNRMMDEGVYL